MANKSHYRRQDRSPLRTFNPQPSKMFKFKQEKILGSLYLIKPLLERMNIKSTIDSIIPERKENGQILTTGEVAEILVANRLHHPPPMKDIKLWEKYAASKNYLMLSRTILMTTELPEVWMILHSILKKLRQNFP